MLTTNSNSLLIVITDLHSLHKVKGFVCFCFKCSHIIDEQEKRLQEVKELESGLAQELDAVWEQEAV